MFGNTFGCGVGRFFDGFGPRPVPFFVSISMLILLSVNVSRAQGRILRKHHKEKTGARIEVFLLRELNEELRLWDVLVDPARKIRIGNKLYFVRMIQWWPK